MDLIPSSDQKALVDATIDWCRDNLPLEQARSRPIGLWSELDAMGWLAMTTQDVGFDHASEVLVFAELGKSLAPVSMLSTAVAARWTGDRRKTALFFVDGNKMRALDVDQSERALGLFESRAVIAALPGGIEATPGLDLSAPLAVIDPALPFEPIDNPQAALHLQLLGAAFAVGCAEAARDMAAEYALVREQFGRPIGWFQALKHLCADMAVRCAMARSQLFYAACALDAGDSGVAFHLAAAKRLADQAALENGRGNIQVHGAVGITDAATPHLCLKRAHMLGFLAPPAMDILLGEAA
ncbi:acyl-CoA dehydrogenase family protein [Sphingobium sp. Sx8-8]|uniref:acyl-CoA dehydrogenase family protein n=1 Tax=Sphingobium sp. Sx8-8 TaxID=2933617 RepID=UPI001F58E668|nr:acyl-CoA dehydrogenase family protein [Sphingobium sp. Sx8-8]